MTKLQTDFVFIMPLILLELQSDMSLEVKLLGPHCIFRGILVIFGRMRM